jgi:O-antigen ligase
VSQFQKALLAIVLVETAFPLDVYLDYEQAEAAYGAIGGWNISLTMVCLAFLYAAWLAQVAVRPDARISVMVDGARPGLFYFAAVCVSAAFSEWLKLSLFEVFNLLPMLLLYIYLLNWVRTRDDVLFVVVLLLLGLALEGAVMVALRGLGHSVQLGPLFARIDATMRVGGAIGSPNEAASYLTLMLGLAVGVFLTDWPLRVRAFAAAAFGLGVLGLAVTLSRGGWIAAGLAVTLACGCALMRGRLSLWTPAVVAACGLIAVGAFSESISERLFRYDKGSAYSRVPLMKIAAEVIEDRPVFGVGANNMTVAMRPYALSGQYRGGFVYVVHNRYLLAWAETGLLGAVAFVVFLGAAVWGGWQCWSRNDPYLAPVGLGIMAGLLGEMLHMTVEVCRGRPVNQLLWILAGLVAAMTRMEAKKSC